MRLYRGLRVDASQADSICADLKANGLCRQKNQRIYKLPLLENPGALLRKPDLRLADTRPATAPYVEMTYASGDLMGASHYAWFQPSPMSKDTPLIIELEVPLEEVLVDGSDFMYMAMSRADHPEAKRTLCRIYGHAITAYVDRAAQHERVTPGSVRTAIFDLAVRDQKIVAAHHGNQTVIRAKSRANFRSWFMIPAELPASRVINAWVPQSHPNMPPFELDSAVLELKIISEMANSASSTLQLSPARAV